MPPQQQEPWLWDQQTLANNFSTMMLQPPPSNDFIMDSDASSHMVSNFDSLSYSLNRTFSTPSHIIVGNGSLLPVIRSGAISFSTSSCPLHLHNVLVSPHIIKNLISIRRFTTDNHCSVEFDPYGLSVKDLAMNNSFGELYSFHPTPQPSNFTATTTPSVVLWHRRLGSHRS